MPYSPEQFQIYSRNEIASLFRGMREKNERLRMRFSDSAEMLVAGVLEVDLKNGCVFLDCALSPVQGRIVRQVRGIHFDAVVNRMRMTFRVSRARQVSFNGGTALVMELPEFVTLYQHRGYARLALQDALIRIPAAPGQKVTGTVKDISIDGMTLIDEAGAISYGVNAVHYGCELLLPDIQPLAVNIRFRNAMMVPGEKTSVAHRIGCQFVDLANDEVVRLRHFITAASR